MKAGEATITISVMDQSGEEIRKVVAAESRNFIAGDVMLASYIFMSGIKKVGRYPVKVSIDGIDIENNNYFISVIKSSANG